MGGCVQALEEQSPVTTVVAHAATAATLSHLSPTHPAGAGLRRPRASATAPPPPPPSGYYYSTVPLA